ncbi:hypothetical protein LA080_012225 [Diaporthe eres]|nr:hypothetical protein LA080_012225 [Diaporthe eres]
MWIIQEVIHADKIRVWCGDKSADWTAFDKLYSRTLASSRDTCTDTQTLVEVFQEWKCSDPRDKVYALVGIAATGTAVVPDYSRSARQVYFDVIDGGDVVDKPKFCNLLSQLLGLSKEDVDLDSQNL